MGWDRLKFLTAVTATALLCVGFWVAPAGAQVAERIVGYDVTLTVAEDGDLSVREVIEYDFASLPDKHGIFRYIPVRYDYDESYERVYRIDDITVRTSGAPGDVEVSEEGRLKLIRIGDPDRTVTGRHTYTIDYRVEGALNGFTDHDELYWNAIGANWTVPIERSTVTVRVPAAVGQVACFAGPEASQLPCASAAADGSGAVFNNGPLGVYQGFTVVVGFPKGAVSDPRPILDEKWTIQKAFAVTPMTVGGSAGLLGLAVLAIGSLAWQQGRDRRFIGSAVDATFGNASGEDEAMPLFSGDETPVEFAPPDNLRPGQIGTLIDEEANTLDVTATMVDLAVRGYMRIEEISKDGLFGKPDWRLVRLREADGKLLPYEKLLFDSLFSGSSEVLLSALRNKFATTMGKVQNALYDDSVEQGWFASRPDRVRGHWIGIGIVVLFLGIFATVGAAWFTRFGLIPIPLVIAGILLLIVSGKMPRRTAVGSGVMRRAFGFRRFIEESEKERAQFAERAHLFTEYLPYAVVFGATEKWAKAFAGLDGQLPQTTGWYVGHHPGVFHAVAFSSAMDNFATTSAGTLTSTPGSSGSSGFSGGSSGGGGGGGGGGSW